MSETSLQPSGDPDELAIYLTAKLAELSSVIHLMTGESQLTAQQWGVIAHLGSAAHHLAIAAELATEGQLQPLAGQPVPEISAGAAENATVPEQAEDSVEITPPTEPAETETTAATDIDIAPTDLNEPEPPVAPESHPAGDDSETEPPAQLAVEVGLLRIEYDFEKLNLSAQERLMFGALLKSVRPEQPFRRADVDFTDIEFTSDDAFSVAFTKLMQKLIDADFLLGRGQRRARKYILNTPGAKEILEAAVTIRTQREKAKEQAPHPSLPPTERQRDPDQEIYEAIVFADRLKKGLKSMISEQQNGGLKASVAAETIASVFGLTTQQSRQILDEYVGQGHFHYARVRGVKRLQDGPAPADSPNGSETRQEAPTRPEAELLAELDRYRTAVGPIMAALIAQRTPGMGMSFEKLWNAIDPDVKETMDFANFKKHLRRMEDDRLIKIEKNARLHTKTPRSSVIRGSKVLIANKSVRDAWKSTPKIATQQLYEQSLEKLFSDIPNNSR